MARNQSVPDLRALYGRVYRTKYEESYYAERCERARTYDPCLVAIQCRHGHIYVHGPTLLGASTDRRGSIAKRLRSLPGVRVVQDGDDGVNVVFALGVFDAVAEIMLPRRRRRMSEEQRQAASERLRAYRFSAGASGE